MTLCAIAMWGGFTVQTWAQQGSTPSVFALPEKRMENPAGSQSDTAVSESVFRLPDKEESPQSRSPFALPEPGHNTRDSAQPEPGRPETGPQLFARATEAAKQGRYEEAGRLYSQVVEIDPDNVKAMNNLGFVLRKLGRNEDALQAYRYAIEADTTYPLTYKNIGILLDMMEDRKGAIEAYQAYVERAPDAPDSGAVRKRIDWLSQ